MSRFGSASVVAILCLVAARPAWGQVAFEQLERQVRQAVGDAGKEPGYVGLIADDRQTAGQGIRVMEVLADGPASAAGLAVGDLIVAVDSHPVRSMGDFARLISDSPPGKKLVLELKREEKTQLVELTLGKRPPPGERRFEQFGQIPAAAAPGPAPPAGAGPGSLGVRFAAVSPAMQQALNLPSTGGALVVGVVKDSPAEKAGIQPGAVVLAVGGQPVATSGDLAQIVARSGAGQTVKLALFQNGELIEREVTLAPGTGPLPSPAGAANLLPPPAGLAPPLAPGAAPPPEAPVTLEQKIEQLEQRVRVLEERLRQFEGAPAGKSTSVDRASRAGGA